MEFCLFQACFSVRCVEEICNEVVAAVPPITVNIQYLDAEKCKTKLKNIRTAVQDYTNNLEGKTGTGSEACEKPEFYDQFRRFMRGSVVTQGPVKIRDSGTGTQPIMRTAADSLPAKLSINEEDLPNIASEEGLMIDFLATANKDSDFVQRQKRQTERLNTWIKQPFDLNSPIPLLSSSPTKNNAPELDRPDIPLPTCTIESTKIRKEDPEKPQPTPKQKRKRGTGDNDDYQERQLEIQQQTLDLNREVAKQNQERHEANLKLQLDIQETNRQNRIVDAAKDRAAQEKADEKYAMMMEALLKKMRD
ncbi:hypothetical protein BCR33DRAFT_367279 [Rhizoclosmatium globosum]|uniref:No apical meristem-associated C-terminal domain-containing protein n=1 Tax=Rhizoclosmatium globosum TaxID=329046 RepID=A0A1Y2C0L6_9FUNG|nr:hypothetical protein BCR33DRAFT_367279 [Rhizoclosmatium globosum]|eukprot:ORY40506.1 hypothetical protein BCR33DRAFT_367279 [Rhizoclosmatium globosum]